MKKLLLIVISLTLAMALFACDKSNDGKTSDPAAQFVLDLAHNQMIALFFDDKWQLKDDKGIGVSSHDYDRMSAFKDDSAVVEKYGKMNLIDKNGNSLFDQDYDGIYKDMETSNVIYKVGQNWGVRDENNNVIVHPIYEDIRAYQQGLAATRMDGSWGFLDATGGLQIPTQYQEAKDFSNGYAAVKNNDMWGYIDDEGNVKIDLKYSYASDFDINNVARVYDGTTQKYYLINKNGDSIITADQLWSSGGPLYAAEQNDLFYFFKSDGTKFTDQAFSQIWFTYDYFATVNNDAGDMTNIWFNQDGTIKLQAYYNNSKYWYNRDERHLMQLVEGMVQSVRDYQSLTHYASGNVMFVTVDQNIEVHIEDKNYILSADDVAQILPDEKFIVERGNSYGIINAENQTVLDFNYDYLAHTQDGFYIFGSNGLYGVMDKNFDTIFPAENQDIAIAPNLLFLVP